MSPVPNPADLFRVARRAGLLRPSARPDRLLGAALAVGRWGLTPAAGYAAGAARHPDRVAIIDDYGQLTYAQVDSRSDAVAQVLRRSGVLPGDPVGVLVRNSAAFVVSVVALSKLGCDVILLNNGLAGPQLAGVLDREQVGAVVADPELAEALAEAGRGRVVVWTRPPLSGADVSVRAACLGGALAGEEVADEAPLPRPKAPGRIVVLTSGTTGAPKGTARSSAGAQDAASLLSATPHEAGDVVVLPAPLFHAWGFANLGIAILLGCTVVLRRRFDPEELLADVARHRAGAVVAVPVMLNRLVDLPHAAVARHDLSALRMVAVSGSALPGDLATRFMDRFGDVLYSLYGSTEAAYVAVAGPAELRRDPGTAGRVLPGVTVRVLGESGPVPAGEQGRIFVGGPMTFGGYTSGDDRERCDGLVSTGDMGTLSVDGLLRVAGRDDDMVISGGENVFPGQVEDVLAALPEVAEVAVLGVPDEQFGTRLAAHMVLQAGAELDEAAVRAAVSSRLARYMVPRDVLFHSALPRNATGKVVKAELLGPAQPGPQ